MSSPPLLEKEIKVRLHLGLVLAAGVGSWVDPRIRTIKAKFRKLECQRVLLENSSPDVAFAFCGEKKV